MNFRFTPWPISEEDTINDTKYWTNKSKVEIKTAAFMSPEMNKIDSFLYFKTPNTSDDYLEMVRNLVEIGGDQVDTTSELFNITHCFIIECITRNPLCFDWWNNKGIFNPSSNSITLSEGIEIFFYLDPIWKEKYPEIFI